VYKSLAGPKNGAIVDEIIVQRSTTVEPPEKIIEEPSRVIYNFRDPILGTCRLSDKKIYFLKTHKTASSVIENIMMRYAWTYNKTVHRPHKGVLHFDFYVPLTLAQIRPLPGCQTV